MTNETKVLTLGEIGMLPNKFLSKSYIEEDTFYVTVDASRFYYDYCYRPFETFNMDEIITSVNDYEFSDSLSSFQTKLNLYKSKGFEIALINLGFFHEIYHPNYQNTIVNDSNSKLVPHVLNYVDMEKVWYVNYYNTEFGDGTINAYDITDFFKINTASHYCLIIYDIQNGKVFRYVDANEYEWVLNQPSEWDSNKTITNINQINRIIKRIIWAYKDTSTVDKNFCPAVNEHIPFYDWDALLEAGGKAYSYWEDTPGSRGLLSFEIDLETTADTKCVSNSDLNWYDNLEIIRNPNSSMSAYEWDEWANHLKNITLETTLKVITSEDIIETTGQNKRSIDFEYQSVEPYSILANINDITTVSYFYNLTFDTCPYNSIPLNVDTIDCEFTLYDWDGYIVESDSVAISYHEGMTDNISIEGDFTFTNIVDIKTLHKPHELIADIVINENDYAWFGCQYTPTTNTRLNYRIELGYIAEPDNAFYIFNTFDSSAKLPSVEYHEKRNLVEYGDIPFYGISINDIDNRILAIKFKDDEYGTDGIALFDFAYQSPEIGKKYTVENADAYIISNNAQLRNYVDGTSPIEISGWNIYETVSASKKYYAVLGDVDYSFYAGTNSPPSYDYDNGEDITYDLKATAQWEDKYTRTYLNNWFPDDYGDFSFGVLARKNMLDCSVSYTEASAAITIEYR